MSHVVSVVTPVFNGGEFLASAIESVRSQTYDDWGLAIIDNASSDDTPRIAERYASTDSRIGHYRYSEHVDANTNHLRAFELSAQSGVYCKVLQADDRLFPRCLEAMVALAEVAPRAGIVGGYRLRGDVIDLAGLPRDVSVVEGSSILRQSLLGGPYVTGSPSSLLYRTDIIRKRVPFLDLGFWHADTEAAYWAFTQADFGLVHDVMSFSRRQPKSRIAWADEMNTYNPENIRFLIRYGPSALTSEEFRSRVKLESKKYLTFLAKQRVKPSRSLVDGFWSFHRDQIDHIIGEARDKVGLGRFPLIARALVGSSK